MFKLRVICFSSTLLNIQQIDMHAKSTIFWNMTPCSLVEIYRHFGGIFRITKSEPSKHRSREITWFLLALFFDPDDVSSKSIRNVSEFLPDYTASLLCLSRVVASVFLQRQGFHLRSRRISGGQGSTGTVFLWVLRFLLLIFIPPSASYQIPFYLVKLRPHRALRTLCSL
jgi:hypothetical protein